MDCQLFNFSLREYTTISLYARGEIQSVTGEEMWEGSEAVTSNVTNWHGISRFATTLVHFDDDGSWNPSLLMAWFYPARVTDLDSSDSSRLSSQEAKQNEHLTWSRRTYKPKLTNERRTHGLSEVMVY